MYKYNDITNVEDVLEDAKMANKSLEDEKPDWWVWYEPTYDGG